MDVNEIMDDMKSIHFVADLHHNHPKIVEIYKRPITLQKESQEYYEENEIDPVYDKFKDLEWKEEINRIHDKWLVGVINNWVGKKDQLYILGDLSFAPKVEAEKFIDKLNGKKFLILGNHDKNIQNSTRFEQITQIKNFNYSKGGANIHIVLCHYPISSWERKVHGSYHLYGHVHGKYKNSGLSLDVGLDSKDLLSITKGVYRPLNLFEIYNYFIKQ